MKPDSSALGGRPMRLRLRASALSRSWVSLSRIGSQLPLPTTSPLCTRRPARRGPTNNSLSRLEFHSLPRVVLTPCSFQRSAIDHIELPASTAVAASRINCASDSRCTTLPSSNPNARGPGCGRPLTARCSRSASSRSVLTSDSIVSNSPSNATIERPIAVDMSRSVPFTHSTATLCFLHSSIPAARSARLRQSRDSCQTMMMRTRPASTSAIGSSYPGRGAPLVADRSLST